MKLSGFSCASVCTRFLMPVLAERVKGDGFSIRLTVFQTNTPLKRPLTRPNTQTNTAHSQQKEFRNR